MQCGKYWIISVCVCAFVRMCVLDCQRDYPSSVSFTKGHMFRHEASSSTEQRTHSTTLIGSHANVLCTVFFASLISSFYPYTHMRVLAAPGICASQILVHAKIPALYSLSADQWPILDMAWNHAHNACTHMHMGIYCICLFLQSVISPNE